METMDGVWASWVAASEAWEQSLITAGRSDGTRRLRMHHLGRFAAAHPDGFDVPSESITAWLSGFADNEYRRSLRSTLSTFYRWAHGTGRLPANPMDAVPTVARKLPSPRPAPNEVYRAALVGADERLRLLLALARGLGMRRHEVARAHSDDLEQDLDGWTLRVLGKGNKVRRIPLPDGLAATLRAWIRENGEGWLFRGQVDGHISAQWVGKLVSTAMPGRWTMHTLRHRFATDAYEVERDLMTLMELCGWASLETARHYVAVPSQRARAMVQAVSAAA